VRQAEQMPNRAGFRPKGAAGFGLCDKFLKASALQQLDQLWNGGLSVWLHGSSNVCTIEFHYNVFVGQLFDDMRPAILKK
jgi:hypothetical protein